MIEQLDIEIIGRVQGVYYRTTLSSIAHSIGINGFVENLDNGSVHVLAQGTREKLEEFLSQTQRGSFVTKVQGLSFKFSKPKKEYSDFEVKMKEGFVKDKIESLKNLGKRVIGDKDIVKVPNHIVIIPDGNRRWAREKSWHPWVGHLKAVKNKNRIMDIFHESARLGVKYVTLWGFSTENWSRDKEEVTMLFNLFRQGFPEFLKEFKKSGVRFRQIGRRDRIPDDVRKNIERMEKETEENSAFNVVFALDYGGRDELIRAIKKMSPEQIEQISEETISSLLDTADIPDPDLIIRTSGEKRTSGVMAWQGTYAELYFTNVLFPDFDAEQLRLAVFDYSYRTRRFGGTADEDLKNIDPKSLKTPDEKEMAALAIG